MEISHARVESVESRISSEKKKRKEREKNKREEEEEEEEEEMDIVSPRKAIEI